MTRNNLAVDYYVGFRLVKESRLSVEAVQLKRFQGDGFVRFPRFICGDRLDELVENVERFLRDVLPSLPDEHVFYEDKSDSMSLKQIQRLSEHDDWFRELCDSGPTRELAEQLLGAPVVLKNLQYFNKPPGIGAATPPHQDGYYFMIDPCEAVTMWLALDDVDEENGCIRYVRGSHTHEMRPHGRTTTLGFSQGIAEYPSATDLMNEVAVCAQPGDLLVHHAMTIHRADANRSETRCRRALGFVYYSELAKEDETAKAAYQQNLMADLKAADRI